MITCKLQIVYSDLKPKALRYNSIKMINNCEFPSQVPLRGEVVFHIKVNYFNDHHWHRKNNLLRTKECTNLFKIKHKNKTRQNSILLILYVWILMSSLKYTNKMCRSAQWLTISSVFLKDLNFIKWWVFFVICSATVKNLIESNMFWI